jgi:tetratricopeptide (TPR) repeat protein
MADPSTAEHWYLLARAYLALKKYPKGYECLQQSVYHKGRVPQFWTTIGILYYQINQYRDSLDAFARSVRLNPSIIENWCNLGILVCN